MSINPFELPKYDLERDIAYFDRIVRSHDLDSRKFFLQYLTDGVMYSDAVRPWVVKLAGDPDYSVKNGVIDLLRKKDRKVLFELMDEFVMDQSPFVKRHVVRTLFAFSESQSIQYLLRLGVDPQPTVRELIAEKAFNLKSAEAMTMLVGLCADQDMKVKIAAMGSLLRSSGQDAPRHVMRFAQGPIEQRKCLAEGMAVSYEGYADLLEELLADDDDEVRFASVKAAFAKKDPAMFRGMSARTEDPDPRIRVLVAHYLGAIGTPEAARMLEEMLEDSEGQVKEAVADAMIAAGLL